MFSVFWFIFFTMLLTSILGIARAPGEAQGILAVIGFFGGFMFLIASLVFLRSSKEYQYQNTQIHPSPNVHGLPGQMAKTALPPQQSIPASTYSAPQPGIWRDTNDLQPTSVTEGTTKLLEQVEQP